VKKLSFFALVTFLLLLVNVCLAEVDTKVFENAEGIKYSYDDMSDSATITPDENIIDLTVDGKAGMQPIIISSDIGGKKVYVFLIYWFAISSDGPISPKSCIIKTDSHRYFFDLVFVDSDNTTVLGKTIETAYIMCGPKSLKMIEDILAAKSSKIRIDGDSDVDYDLSEIQKRALENMYNAYKDSGCTKQDLSALDILTPITVK
jgi:hypothetical protein